MYGVFWLCFALSVTFAAIYRFPLAFVALGYVIFVYDRDVRVGVDLKKLVIISTGWHGGERDARDGYY